MSNYTPQVGDRVRRTYPDGTIMEGVIARLRDGCADSAAGFTLHNDGYPEQTELLERPVKLNTAPGTVYGHRDNAAHRVVRVAGGGEAAWLGYVGNDDDYHWHEDEDITKLITEAGWVECNLDGSIKW